MDFGLAALQQTITESKSKGGGSDSKLNYISWKEGETKIVRFLTNEVLSATFADRVVSNDGKTKDFLIDESKGDFVAKYGGKAREFGGGGQLIEPKLSKKGVAVAVLRDERPDPANPGRTEFLDHLTVVENKGQNYQGRFFGIIKQGIKNFWTPLLATAARCDGLCDRDWAITRIGGDKDTLYAPIPIEPVGDILNAMRDLAVVQQYYGYGRPWNPEAPDRFLYCPETLIEWADYYSGEERAKFWLTPKAPAAAQQVQGLLPTVPGMPLINPALVQSGLVNPNGVSTVLSPPAAPQGLQGYVPGPQGAAVTPTPAAEGLNEFHAATTLNPATLAATGSPISPPPQQVVMQAPPVLQPPPFAPTVPGQPTTATGGLPPLPTPTLGPTVNQGPWGANEDEAQAMPSGSTDWASLQAKLLPGLAQAAAPTAPAAQQ
jgi:hypothetical protein